MDFDIPGKADSFPRGSRSSWPISKQHYGLHGDQKNNIDRRGRAGGKGNYEFKTSN